jgi:hypothetical protein
LAELALPMYPAGQLEQDRELVLKKLGLTPKEWDEIMQLPVRRHTDFETERSAYTMYPWLKPLRPLVNLAKYFLRRRPAGG